MLSAKILDHLEVLHDLPSLPKLEFLFDLNLFLLITLCDYCFNYLFSITDLFTGVKIFQDLICLICDID